MIKRNIEKEFLTCMSESPVVMVTGPRQSGKTTLARTLCKDYSYVTFEDPLVRDQFFEDPRGFLHLYQYNTIFDEAQHVPELFSFLQGMVDDNRAPGRFVITGSQQFGLLKNITQSLAGRVAILELLPFSSDELEGAGWLKNTIENALWTGAYPPVHHRELRPERWYADYVSTYVQRDVFQISALQYLDQFTKFVKLCAGNTGQLFNASRLGSDCGVDQKTVKKWLLILKTGYIAAQLSPYQHNFRKRIIKTPKMFFYDTGLICHLLGIHTPMQLVTHPLKGAVFESWAFSELTKMLKNNAVSADLFFWRTHGGQEVDFIIEYGGKIIGIEVKAGMSIKPTMLRSLNNTIDAWPVSNKHKIVIYGGDERMHLSGCDILPWRQISKIYDLIIDA